MTDYIDSGAVISEDYRYKLWRVWDSHLPVLVWCMLNPSTANGLDDDPTIKKCVGFAKRWGYGGIVVVNLFAFRATKPKDLLKSKSPVGPNNKQAVLSEIKDKDVVCAWGHNVKKFPIDQLEPMYNLIRDNAKNKFALGFTNNGCPRHPLMLSYDTPFVMINFGSGKDLQLNVE